jgi:large subunit ribosomal protein L35
MPKQKTRKCAVKRIRRSATGKLKHAKAGRGHLLSAKRPSRKRRLRRGGVMHASDVRRIRALMP